MLVISVMAILKKILKILNLISIFMTEMSSGVV